MLNNTEIIGIDHGNRNMKTASSVFSAAIQPLQTRPDSLENILEYQNKIYYVGGQVPVMERVDKTDNDDYYLLTLAALAKELKFRKLTSSKVMLGTALPPRRFQQQKDGFKKYLSKTKELHFKFEGIHYHVTLENVYVFMKCGWKIIIVWNIYDLWYVLASMKNCYKIIKRRTKDQKDLLNIIKKLNQIMTMRLTIIML